MDINEILSFIKCPYCSKGLLKIKNKEIFCLQCLDSFDIIEGVPILIKKENLCLQELRQLDWFDKHYTEFSREEYKLENWRLSMVNRILETSFKERIRTYLDIGCGTTGYTVIEAAKKNNWISFGVDISVEAMLRAKNLAENQGVDSITAFLVCSAENLPFRMNSIDYISAISLLEHLENDERAIKNFHSILKKEGYLYICVPNTYRRMWPFLWPIYLYLDYKIGHKRHYAIEDLNKKMKNNDSFELANFFYNGHLVKLCQIILDKLHLINDKNWWLMEKKDINRVSSGIQLNAIYRKK